MKSRYLVPRLRIALVREEPLVSFPAAVMRTSRDVAEGVAPLFADTDRESFWILGLDGKNVAIGPNRVSEGTLTASLVHPREVFKPLLLMSAAAGILVHNHPSGDPAPSAEDVAITRRLREVGELHGIAILDHVIIGDGTRYLSFADAGLL
jgi:DNA repair protein RadC